MTIQVFRPCIEQPGLVRLARGHGYPMDLVFLSAGQEWELPPAHWNTAESFADDRNP